MLDESRDPELEWVRVEWDAPPPTRGFHDRVLGTYVRESPRAPIWRRWTVPWPIAAAAAIAAILLAFYFSRRKPEEGYYQPVRQPRFIVISQGEHP